MEIIVFDRESPATPKTLTHPTLCWFFFSFSFFNLIQDPMLLRSLMSNQHTTPWLKWLLTNYIWNKKNEGEWTVSDTLFWALMGPSQPYSMGLSLGDPAPPLPHIVPYLHGRTLSVLLCKPEIPALSEISPLSLCFWVHLLNLPCINLLHPA